MAKKLKKVDVVVVGSGWAGGVVSAELAKAGYQVVTLERGKKQDRQDYVGVKDELRYTDRYEMMQNLSPETITSRVKIEDTALPVRTRAEMMAGTDLGGGSVHWAGATYRWRAIDFELRSKTIERYGKEKIPEGMTIQDWGITYDEMEPYYDKWEKTAGISGEPDPLGDKRSSDYPNPPMLASPAVKLFKETTERMGYHPFQVAAGNLSRAYTNPDGEKLNACMFCSYCTMYGCDFTAKSDPLATVIPTARKTGNCEIRTNSLVRRVLHKDGKATGVMFTDTRTGIEYEQPADVVVLGAFSFTNNRLLMLSKIGTQYDPTTRKGTIGRNFNGQFNITFLGARGYFEKKKFNLYMGAGALGGTMSDFAGDNFDHSNVDFINGGGIEMRQYGDGAISTNHVPSGTPKWGPEFKKNSIHYANRSLVAWYTPAVMSWWHNYVDLDPTYKDEYGDPLLRITNRYTDHDRNMAKFGIEKCSEIMKEMGADIIDEDEVPEEFDHIYSGGHYAGGIIMGADPETSAVNNYLQMWEMDNLFVVGGSAFPQFGGHHPTSTIGALAYRAAEGVEKYLNNGGQLAEAKQKTLNA
ncbi:MULTISPECIES: GMC family oxidoreductase [unclassified Sporosarcina]|uniref:GMC family oxidoreductase n=1 Tax=unclassified Sporosarcina TaxID=2647733 RepID=UPI000C1638EE|nr:MULTISPECIES: GMC family oxidoreductase [unclassified Sporosarcina]PID05564.1 GMC family oxidoreductase [Sporosarcina sp. P30]PID08758.1 GMC family oxidoreductase [Sporosarcina sp. P31]PID11930.1 GMC family oxidoreductase [Sporosarcina sp. P32b]